MRFVVGLLASMMGSIAFQKGLGVTHSCAHALSTVYDAHHGFANAYMLLSCMEFNREQCKKQFEIIGSVVNEDPIDWMKSLLEKLNILTPEACGHLKVTKELLDIANSDPCHGLNPRPVSRNDFEKLFNDAQNRVRS